MILVRCLPTTKEWHGIKVKLSDQKKKKHNLVLKVDLTAKRVRAPLFQSVIIEYFCTGKCSIEHRHHRDLPRT